MLDTGRETEIDEFGVEAGVEKDVLELDVAVADAVLVEVGYCLDEGGEDSAGVLLGGFGI